MSTAERGAEDVRESAGARPGKPAEEDFDTPLPDWSLAEYGEDAEADADVARRRRESVRRDSLWVEEPAVRRRLPDPVRTSAVRAVIVVALTLSQAVTAFLCTLAGSWLAFPMVVSSVASTVVATWAVLDVWVTRQVWNQRNGVESLPGSTARQLRRERRLARRAARAAARDAARERTGDPADGDAGVGGERGTVVAARAATPVPSARRPAERAGTGTENGARRTGAGRTRRESAAA
ncbi:hypothetical protein [Streptomyces sp. NPDC007088]|uniref:hypothetical protein n=1 Tax=Streptomyces sp. NPDC007088 TaxID=3364773 RepID=UPI0036BAD286